MSVRHERTVQSHHIRNRPERALLRRLLMAPASGSMRRLCNQAGTRCFSQKEGLFPDLQADSGACLHHDGNAAQVPCRERKGVSMPHDLTGPDSQAHTAFSASGRPCPLQFCSLTLALVCSRTLVLLECPE